MAKEECVAPLEGHVSVQLITVNMESLQKRRYCSFQSQKRRGERGRIRYGAETTGKAQVVSALSVPFVLEGLFGEADAEPDLELAADAMGMDVEKKLIRPRETRRRTLAPLTVFRSVSRTPANPSFRPTRLGHIRDQQQRMR
jgi:hypothetical protein